MSAFEFFFAFFGLMLGLSLANVAAGFGRLWRVRSSGSMGWCVPLVALLILTRIMTMWIATWSDLQDIHINAVSLFTALGIALPYVLASTLMFPDDSGQCPDLDAFYMSHARVLLVVLAVPPLAGLIGFTALLQQAPGLWDWARHLSLLVAPLVVMLVWRKLWVHRLVLSLMVLDELRYMVFG